MQSTPRGPDDLAIALSQCLSRDARFEQQQNTKRRAVRLATALGIIASVFSTYDLLLLARAVPH